MKIYIAGPITGMPDYNKPLFNAAEKMLRDLGHDPVNPIKLDHGKHSGPWIDYLRRDVAYLAGCRGILMLPGWRKSRGARRELQFARDLELLLFEYVDGKEKTLQRLSFDPGKDADMLVNGDRQKDYGHAYDDFSRTAALWSAILGKHVTPQQVALCMVAVKISRQCHAPKEDNIVDGIGYFMTLAMVNEEERMRRLSTNLGRIFDENIVV